MMLDPTYKTVEIADDDELEAKVAKVMLRAAHFMIESHTMIMSEETISKIIGTDKYNKLVLAVMDRMTDESGGKISDFVRRELIEME